MGPALQPYIFVGQGPCALPGVRYGIGGRTEVSAPTKVLQEGAVRGKNPPVTASPCQPPLGKGAWGRGTRIATTSLRTGLAMTWFIMGEGHLVGGWLMPVGGGNACIRSCWWRMTGPWRWRCRSCWRAMETGCGVWRILRMFWGVYRLSAAAGAYGH